MKKNEITKTEFEDIWDYIVSLGDSLKMSFPFVWEEHVESKMVPIKEPNSFLNFLEHRWLEKFSRTISDATLQQALNILNCLGIFEFNDNYSDCIEKVLKSPNLAQLKPCDYPEGFTQCIIAAVQVNYFVGNDGVEVVTSDMKCFPIHDDQAFSDLVIEIYEKETGRKPSNAVVNEAIKVFRKAVAVLFDPESWEQRVSRLMYHVYHCHPDGRDCQFKINRGHMQGTATSMRQ
jgi:hypothetical protein